ncbi:MAG: hypothetical protein AAB893_02680 [Patescibacteria group bacterium]
MNILFDVLTPFYTRTKDYLPNFIYGFVLLIVGLLLSEGVRKFFSGLVRFFRLTKFLKTANLAKEKEIDVWVEVLGGLFKWIVVILFLIPAAQIWGFTQFTSILNSILLYLPNVIVGVILALVGHVFANLSYDLVLNSVRSINPAVSGLMATVSKYSILVFTALVVLNQLGVAQDLIRILFTGVVVMLALAGGRAVGLGGKDTARELLEEVKKDLHK